MNERKIDPGRVAGCLLMLMSASVVGFVAVEIVKRWHA